ncbi:peptidylprolyl isomerase [Lysinibacillus sp. fkY74-1]|uniref:peptidylprolyl isomerase n=1 Tax=Lysinibacillus TaxID=400634 RepID=UPI000563A85F|nr:MULTISPECIES: peptidylprolyl isomerase [Lysinibacillus]MBG9689976.1 foldase [Lysinibacillus sphaericus]MBG9757387.1 foldase [Lysinibacillus sphaericus]MBI6863292.1 peptidylprolyl isomerase [Lysinibacillus fusiformis]MDM5352485.1 peptidylprolyl isomerase [Lysinibacillus sphaericus]MEB7454278.1 peptidylprolyl isomerase [Lysinibacillus sphaericus]
MKKTVLSLTLAASVLALGACSGGDSKAIVTSKVGDISVADFNEKAKSLTGSYVLQQMVTEKVLSDKYEVTDKELKEAYDTTASQFGDGFAQALAESGLTEQGFKDSLRVQLLQEKALKDQAIKEEDVKKYYEQMKTELNGRHILVADEKTAKEVIEKIKGGAKFADVAKEYSTDTGSAQKGGELGWFSVGSMVDEFNDAAYALELNTLSEPVKSSFGYHVIEITEKRDVKDVGSFKDEEEKIRTTMLSKLNQTGEAQTILKDIVAKMAKDANVKTSDKDLKDSLEFFTTTSEEQAKAAEEEAKKAEEKASKEESSDKAEDTDKESK